MRLFDLMRNEDATGISGTGCVAQGVVFEDGHVVMRWLTAHRSTTLFPDIDTVQTIHGHEGRTLIVFRDGSELVEIPKPHLHLGNEGKYADGSQYDQGGGAPSMDGARMQYDRLGKIEAQRGWSAVACWEIGGGTCLIVRSPSVYLRAENCAFEGVVRVRKHYRRQELTLYLEPGKDTKQDNMRGKEPGDVVRVGGVEYQARWGEYST